MKLVAEILTGRLFFVEVEEDSTVGDFKKEMANQESLPINRLILILDDDGRRVLMEKDEVPLSDYGAGNGSHVYVFFKAPAADEVPQPNSPQPPQSNSALNEPSPSSNVQSNEASATVDQSE